MALGRVAVVGAGVAGLASIKSSLEEGLLPVCFERSDDLGGLWYYRSEVRDGEPSLYKSCVINTSKEMSCFSDFPIPKEFPTFMHRSYFLRYFHLYADHFHLRDYIHFQHEVEDIRQTQEGDGTKWQLTVKDLQTGQVRREVFDFVLVCNGHLYEPNLPNTPGVEEFQGRVMHTHDYKDFRGFEDKVVMVIGMGNSGADVATELSRHAKQVYLSTRRGAYVIQRAGGFGEPFDQEAIRRFRQLLPAGLMRPFHFYKINYKYNHGNYGLAPNFRFDAGVSTISDDLPNRILVGALIMKPDVTKLTKNGAVFEDDTVLEGIDCIIFATGFKFSFPFIKGDQIKVENHFPYLYQLVFPPQSPGLAVVGLIQPFGALPVALEMQARVATRVFAGKCRLPPADVMLRAIECRRAAVRKTFVDSPRYILQVYIIHYLDELGEMIGCRPQLWKLFLTDLSLWCRVFFGPATPPQWRLVGPGSWQGARRAIETVEENTYYPMMTRKAGEGDRDGLFDGWWALLRTLIIGLLAALCLIYVAG